MGELAAVDTWMYVREGKEAPSYEEIIASYEKFIPEADRITETSEDDAGSGRRSFGHWRRASQRDLYKSRMYSLPYHSWNRGGYRQSRAHAC